MTKPDEQDRDSLLQQALPPALLATHAYQKYENLVPLPDTFRVAATSDEIIGETTSGFSGKLYTDGNRFVISFCGFSDAGDILPVIEAGFKGLPSQLDDALNFTLLCAEKYGIDKSQMEFTGHSLGGYLAKSIGLYYGGHTVWTFNNPGLKFGDDELLRAFFNAKGIDSPEIPPAIVTINSAFDLVSKWGVQKGRVIEVETEGNHHNMTVLIERMAGICFIGIEQQEHPSTLRLAMREIFDNIGRSEKITTALRNIFSSNPPSF